MKQSLASRKSWLVGGLLTAASAAGLLAVGTHAMRPTAAHAQDRSNTFLISQSAGPVRVQRGQRALIGLLLPAVQHVTSAHASLTFLRFPTDAVLGHDSLDLTGDAHGLILVLDVDRRGHVFVNGRATDATVGEHDGLALAAVAEVNATTDAGELAPPCSILHVYDERGGVIETVPLNFLPAVQRPAQ